MLSISTKILDRTELREWCDALKFYPAPEIIDPIQVPEHLRILVPYAEIWGHRDEEKRSDTGRVTPAPLKQHLVAAIYLSDVDRKLNDWFSTCRANGPPFSDGYISFLCLFQTVAEF